MTFLEFYCFLGLKQGFVKRPIWWVMELLWVLLSIFCIFEMLSLLNRLMMMTMLMMLSWMMLSCGAAPEAEADGVCIV